MKELKVVFGLIILLSILIAVLIANQKVIHSNISKIHPNEFRSYVESFGIIAPLILFLFQSLQAIIPILPGSVITIASGIILGGVIGSIISLFGALVGAIAVFYISKYFGREFVGWLIHRKDLGKYDEMFKKNGLVITFLLRAIPFVDFGFASYMISTSSISFRDYFFGTLLGSIPTTIVYVYYGSKFLQYPILFSILGIILLMIFIILPYIPQMEFKG